MTIETAIKKVANSGENYVSLLFSAGQFMEHDLNVKWNVETQTVRTNSAGVDSAHINSSRRPHTTHTAKLNFRASTLNFAHYELSDNRKVLFCKSALEKLFGKVPKTLYFTAAKQRRLLK